MKDLTMSKRRNWGPIIVEAADYAQRFDGNVTLGQLHYMLVSNPNNEYRNVESDYTQLSSRTAEARRRDLFPDLVDHIRSIDRPPSWDSPRDVIEAVASQYRRDRTEGQSIELLLIVEKATLLGRVRQWAEPYGIPVVALRGCGSQTIASAITDDAGHVSSKVTMLYVGDHDPSGQDIQRDIVERTDCVFGEVVRLAVNPDQVDELGLYPAPGKTSDSRAAGFTEQYRELIQVEVEAIDPDVLRGLVVDAIEVRTDHAQFARIKDQEAVERRMLADLARSMP
jgi:hypothetical protein